jgi:hypothetical protein
MKGREKEWLARADDISTHFGRNRLACLGSMLIEQDAKESELSAADLR